MFEYDGRKYQRLITRRDQLSAVNRDLVQRLSERQRKLKKFEVYAEAGELSKKDTDEIPNLRSDIEFLRTELATVQQKLSVLTPAISVIEGWLKSNRTKPDYTRPQPSAPNDIRRAEKELAKVREQITQLIAERDAIQFAPLPRAEAEQRIANWVAEQAANSRIHRFGEHVVTPRAELPNIFQLSIAGMTVDGSVALPVDIGPTLCALFGDTIRERLAATLPDDDGAIPMAERPAKIAKLDKETAGVTVVEEELVSSLEAAGETVARRADVDPMVVLAVRVVPDPPQMVAVLGTANAPRVAESQYLASGGAVRP